MNFETWMQENYTGGYNENHSCNGLDWKLVEMPDNWIAIWQYNPYSGQYSPAVQARDIDKALDYIVLKERVDVPLERIS